jgi:hypothetical protein
MSTQLKRWKKGGNFHYSMNLCEKLPQHKLINSDGLKNERVIDGKE